MNRQVRNLKDVCALLHYCKQQHVPTMGDINEMIDTVEEIYHAKKDAMYGTIFDEATERTLNVMNEDTSDKTIADWEIR